MVALHNTVDLCFFQRRVLRLAAWLFRSKIDWESSSVMKCSYWCKEVVVQTVYCYLAFVKEIQAQIAVARGGCQTAVIAAANLRALDRPLLSCL